MIALTLAAVLQSSQPAHAPGGLSPEKTLALLRIQSCLYGKALEADDGISDPSTIASVIQGDCLVEAEKVMSVYEKQFPTENRPAFRRRFEAEMVPKMAVKAVLDERKPSALPAEAEKPK